MKTNRLWLAAFLLLGTCLLSCKKDDDSPATPKKTFVLVHGAWSGKYAWAKVQPLLESAGNKVIIFDLPAHGDDYTPVAQATTASYVQRVTEAINAEPGQVILVGHSLAGMVISQVAEAIPDKLDKLVYLSAFLPQNGQFVLGFQDTQSLFGANLVLSADQRSAKLNPSVIVPIFAPDCPPDIQQMVLDRHRTEPLQPFMNPAVLTAANFGRVPKYYIKTLRDVGVGSLLQKKMIRDNGTVVRVDSLDCSHGSFFAKPTELAAILNGM